jgi:hypothetical protein
MPHSKRAAAGGADSGGGFIQQGASPSSQAISFTQPQMPESSTQLRSDPLHKLTDISEVTSLPAAEAVHPAVYVLPQHAMAGMRSSSTSPASLSVPNYADVGLSTELTNMLGRSSFDPGRSAIGSVVGGAYAPFLPAAGHPPAPSPQDQIDGRECAERQVRRMYRKLTHIHIRSVRLSHNCSHRRRQSLSINYWNGTMHTLLDSVGNQWRSRSSTVAIEQGHTMLYRQCPKRDNSMAGTR